MTAHYNDLYARCDDIAETVASLEKALQRLAAQVAQLERLVGNHLYGSEGTRTATHAEWSWPV